jgi:hypothetical protein
MWRIRCGAFSGETMKRLLFSIIALTPALMIALTINPVFGPVTGTVD